MPNFAFAQYLNFTSNNSESFQVGSPSTFTVTTQPTSAYPFNLPPVLVVVDGNYPPPGMVFTDNGDFTATIAGTPNAAGSFPFIIAANSPYPPANQLATQSFYATVALANVTVSLASFCTKRTFVENQPFTVISNVTGPGPGVATGTLTLTQDPPGNTLYSTAAPTLSYTITSLATTGSDTQDNYLLETSYSGNSNFLPGSSPLIGVTVLSSADVVFRTDFEEVPEGCPAE
ncbi:MAG: hypothetical protein JSS28_00420 [Proteobacteria bacterium]|nr:hypothetical protein [Pseudomonadota bacterium]